jgi:hypothetical protein
MARTRGKRKVKAPHQVALDATPERLSKGDGFEFINPAHIDDTEQPIGRVRRFRASMLDRLHDRGKLTYAQWYAGDVYRNTYHRAAIGSSAVSSYGERSTGGECSYGLPRTESQLRARRFIRDASNQLPFEDRGFIDRFLIYDDLPRYGGRQAMRTVSQIRLSLDLMAVWMRLQTG